MAVLWEGKLESDDDSEPHWSTSTIMAIFMASCLVTAVFFGLGYSFGRGGTAKSVQNAAITAKTDAPMHGVEDASEKPQFREIASVNNSSRAKEVTAPASTLKPQANRTATHAMSAAPIERAALIPVPERNTVSKEIAKGQRANQAEKSSKNSHYMVQVGAVGNQRDARKLVAQLRRHGIHATIYPGRHDRFLHVQVGPFSSEQQARTMRHHILANGYRAILKRA